MPLSGYLEDRLGVRITILIGKYMDQISILRHQALNVAFTGVE
jgi:hypothetical protein